MSKAAFVFLVTLMTVTLALSSGAASRLVLAQFEQWVPYAPPADRTTLSHWIDNGTSFVQVSFWVDSSGYEVRNWGTPSISGSSVSVNAEAWRWTGASAQVILTFYHTYNLGNLPNGQYTFFFRVWGLLVKSLAFNVSAGTPSTTVVPDDYPTIQEAINNANPGTTVFIRNGTYDERAIVNKSLMLIGESRDGVVLNASESFDPIVTVDASDVLIAQFTMQGWSPQDVLINSSMNVLVTENKFVFFGAGVYLQNAHNCTLSANVFEGNGLDNAGILVDHSYDSVLEHNTISNAVFMGIRLWYSHDILVTENNVSHNDAGINLYESVNNTVSLNYVSSIGAGGLELEGMSVNNTVYGNTFRENFLGVRASSSFNRFYHNNFINNTSQASTSPSNLWDNGCEGNYWSDYNGTDADGDGVGDTPYFIDANGQDNFPLMNPYWNGADVNHDLKVDVKDVYAVAAAFGTFSTGPNPQGREYNPHCDINGDGKVDMKDYYFVCRNYGQGYS